MEDFPVSIYPTKMQEIILQLESKLGFPLGFISTSVFVTSATAIGKTYKLQVRTSWYESTGVFICLVGRPGANKSHPLSWAIKPLLDATEKKFQEAILESEGYSKEDMMSNNIPEPTIEQYVANNVTPEAMIQIMSETNIRLMIWNDELSGFLKNLNKYNAGSDTEFLLSVFSNKTALINRKTQKKAIIKDAYACIAGTTQPMVLKSLFKLSENNGLYDRFLFTTLEDLEKKKMSKEDLNPEVVSNYKKIIDMFLNYVIIVLIIKG